MNLSQIRPLPDDFIERCHGVSNKQLMKHYGCGHSTMARWRQEVNIPCIRWRGGNDPRPMPDDFKELAVRGCNSDLAKRYRTSICMIQRWRRESGIRGTYQGVKTKPRARKPVPTDFATMARIETSEQLKVRYKVSGKLIARWRDETRVFYERPKKEPKPKRERPPRPERAGRAARKVRPSVVNSMGRAHHVGFAPPRDTSLEGSAAEVLRKYAATYRCDSRGRYDTTQPKDCWRFGNVLLSADELFERARAKGWEASL